ncbi:MAG TPA: hypothetical protein VF144_10460, partial [Chitinophagaceae bacterium]
MKMIFHLYKIIYRSQPGLTKLNIKALGTAFPICFRTFLKSFFMSSIRFKKLAGGLILLCLLFSFHAGYSQIPEQFVKVIVAPDHSDWTYTNGEKAKFTITVLQNGNALKNVFVKYEIGPEKMEPIKKDSQLLANGTLVVEAGSMKDPGFLRCIATTTINNKTYRGLATAAFEPLKIAPTVAKPADFTAYWEKAKADLAKIPIDARMT